MCNEHASEVESGNCTLWASLVDVVVGILAQTTDYGTRCAARSVCRTWRSAHDILRRDRAAYMEHVRVVYIGELDTRCSLTWPLRRKWTTSPRHLPRPYSTVERYNGLPLHGPVVRWRSDTRALYASCYRAGYSLMPWIRIQYPTPLTRGQRRRRRARGMTAVLPAGRHAKPLVVLELAGPAIGVRVAVTEVGTEPDAPVIKCLLVHSLFGEAIFTEDTFTSVWTDIPDLVGQTLRASTFFLESALAATDYAVCGRIWRHWAHIYCPDAMRSLLERLPGHKTRHYV